MKILKQSYMVTSICIFDGFAQSSQIMLSNSSLLFHLLHFLDRS